MTGNCKHQHQLSTRSQISMAKRISENPRSLLGVRFQTIVNRRTAKAVFYLLSSIFCLLAFVFVLRASESGLQTPDPGLSYTWRNVVINGGGFVPGIVFNTSEPNLVYARTDIGGAYRWNPDNETWIPLLDWVGFDEWNLTGVDSLATDARDPNRVYLAAGTYTNEWTSMNGAILRSTDRGNTWQRTDLPFKVGGNMPGRSMGERLAIDP